MEPEQQTATDNEGKQTMKKKPISATEPITTEMVIKALRQREERVRREQQHLQCFRNSLLDIISNTIDGGKVQVGIIHNNLLSNNYCCYLCHRPIQTDMVVPCVVGLSDNWEYICETCLADFDSIGQLSHKLREEQQKSHKEFLET